MSDKKDQTPREIMEKLGAMTPKEFSDFMHDHFQRLCSKPLGDRKPPADPT